MLYGQPVSARLVLLPVLVAAGVTQAGCAGADGNAHLDVSAASSLKTALTASAPSFDAADLRFSFAGSQQLAAQIRAGARPDLFASADSQLPDALAAAGLAETPVSFARNELVLAVPARGGKVRSLTDLGDGGVTLAIGAPAVPVGAYARAALDRLAPRLRLRALSNVRSSEPDVAGVVGKLAVGAVDAGFVYITDVRAAGGRLRAIRLPRRVQPQVLYKAQVIRGARNPALARAYIESLIRGPAARALREAGFLPPP